MFVGFGEKVIKINDSFNIFDILLLHTNKQVNLIIIFCFCFCLEPYKNFLKGIFSLLLFFCCLLTNKK